MEKYWPQRRHPRHFVELSVVCGDGPRLADRVINISAAGARIDSPSPLPAGSHHDFRFAVPDTRHRTLVVPVSAMVVWVGARAMGIWFEGRYAAIEDLILRIERCHASL